MANINAGKVTLESGTYEVILRKVKGNTDGTNYKNNIEYENESNSNDNTSSGRSFTGGSRKTRKANKSMEGGKRKLSGYMKFGKARRPEIISAHPEWKGDVVAVAKEIGKQWRALSDAEKAKY